MTPTKDYSFQQEDIRRLLVSLRVNRRVAYILPTGGGKTPVATGVALRWTQRWDSRVVWLAHREELQEQAEQTLLIADPRLSDFSYIVTSPIKLRNALRTGRESFSRYDLLVVDEAHHATAKSWAQVILEWPGAVLGVTATLWRLSRKQGFDHLYNNMVVGPSKQALIGRNVLVPSLVRQPRGHGLIRGRGSNSRGDYSTEATMAQSNVVLVERGIDWLVRWSRIEGRTLRTLIYCLNIPHVQAVYGYIRSLGINAEILTADTPKSERVETIRRFRQNETPILINIAILSEGFDVPGVEAVLILRVTQSLALYLQIVGRANRADGQKQQALIFDATDNTTRFGHPDDDREWSLAARGTQNGTSPSPTRCCHECQTVQDSSRRSCLNCGEPFGIECGRCGWASGRGDGSAFRLPEIDPETGECYRCSIIAQDRLFNDEVMTYAEFVNQFTENGKGNFTFHDTAMSARFWLKQNADGRGLVIGGGFCEDRVANRYMPAGSVEQSGDGAWRMVFDSNPHSVSRHRASGRSIQTVYKQLYGVYRSAAESIEEALASARS